MVSRRANRMTAFAAALVVALMVGASFAAVALYRIFCQVTGFGGTTQVAGQDAAQSVARDAAAPLAKGARTITVSMLGNVNPALPWSFAPVKPKVTLRVGENALVYYRAVNHSDKTVTGVATFNVTPHKAGPYFVKVECFCFSRQTLKPGESVDMPVSFYVDPALAKDRKLAGVTDIALSQTFFRAPEQDELAARQEPQR
jgi:cytochrome c oxidase assembly protein subunit 11